MIVKLTLTSPVFDFAFEKIASAARASIFSFSYRSPGALFTTSWPSVDREPDQGPHSSLQKYFRLTLSLNYDSINGNAKFNPHIFKILFNVSLQKNES